MGLHDDILNIYNKDQLEQEVTYSTILKRTKDKGLKYNNPYRRY